MIGTSEWLETIPEDFSHWFAGCVDGEGSFVLIRGYGRRGLTKGSYHHRLAIGLHIQELPLLEEIRGILSMGDIQRKPAKDGHCSMAHLVFQRKRDCQRLVALFQRFPLRSHKKKEFEIWAECVNLWCSGIMADGLFRQAQNRLKEVRYAYKRSIGGKTDAQAGQDQVGYQSRGTGQESVPQSNRLF
ncbi:hypothetical protein ES705_43077 [subsurface metagenome]